jgi:hypothetical protein
MMNFKDVVSLCEVGKEGPWVLGGAARKEYFGLQQDSDYDIYFQSEEVFEYTNNILLERALPDINNYRYRYIIGGAVIELCLFFYPTIKEHFDNFDFTVCQFGYDGSSFHFGQSAILDWNHKRLSLVTKDSKIYTKHMEKYVARGLVPDFDVNKLPIDRVENYALYKKKDVPGQLENNLERMYQYQLYQQYIHKDNDLMNRAEVRNLLEKMKLNPNRFMYDEVQGDDN